MRWLILVMCLMGCRAEDEKGQEQGQGVASDADADTDAPAYAGFDNTSIERSAVGYIEIIEMGQLDPNATAVLDTATTGAINAAAAITHDSDGVPANCALLCVIIGAWIFYSAR